MKDVQLLLEKDRARDSGIASRKHGCKPAAGLPPGANARGEPSRMKVSIGKLALSLCSNAKGECKKPRCVLRPFCECARAELGAGRSLEATVWAAVALSGVVMLVVAFFWAVHSHR